MNDRLTFTSCGSGAALRVCFGCGARADKEAAPRKGSATRRGDVRYVSRTETYMRVHGVTISV